ncbi:MAG: leucine-rich repeat protein [Clostridia bacterium]
MIIIICASVLFILMLLFPLMGSVVSYHKNKTKPLFINPSKSKDPRYFSLSFSHLFDSSWEHYDGSGTLKLSRPETITEADTVSSYSDVCTSIVFAQTTDFAPPPGTVFQKEIYAKQNARLCGIPSARAVCCKKDLILGDDIHIDRWADAEGTFAVYDGCDLGLSASSATLLMLGHNCKFKRLFSPIICFGQYPGAEIPPSVDTRSIPAVISHELLRNVEYVEAAHANKAGVVEYTVISNKNVDVVEDLMVQGDIRSHKSIRVCDGAIVCGNLFAEDDILLGKNACVLGTMFTQGDVFADEGAIVGQYGKISSVIARGKIVFSRGCRVYGYVSSEAGGICWPDDPDNDSPRDAPPAPRYATHPPLRTHISFASAAEYNALDELGLRKDMQLEVASLPEGALKVKRSLFFECARLSRVELPSTITTIEDFAFFGCTQLESIDLSRCTQLESIDESAFEGCISLKELKLPASLLVLGVAAFSGCSALERVTFGRDSKLHELGSHAFFNCAALKKIKLPLQIEVIGLSAFYGCASLESMELPASVHEIGGYAFYGCSAMRRLYLHAPLSDAQKAGMPEHIELCFTSHSQEDTHYGY